MGSISSNNKMNNNLIVVIAGFLSGLFGAMGLGGGGVLIIYLTVFAEIKQFVAQGINIIFFISIAFIAVLMYNVKKLVSWNIVIPYSILGIIGAILGASISNSINSTLLSKMFGLLLLFMGIYQLFSKNKN